MLPPKLNWRIRMNRTLAGLLVMISPLLLSACDALTYVGVSVEGQAICTLTIVKAGNVTMADEPLVEGFKFSVVMNKSLSDKLVKLHVKCDNGLDSSRTFKLGEIAGKRVVFEQSGNVRIVDLASRK